MYLCLPFPFLYDQPIPSLFLSPYPTVGISGHRSGKRRSEKGRGETGTTRNRKGGTDAAGGREKNSSRKRAQDCHSKINSGSYNCVWWRFWVDIIVEFVEFLTEVLGLLTCHVTSRQTFHMYSKRKLFLNLMLFLGYSSRGACRRFEGATVKDTDKKARRRIYSAKVLYLLIHLRHSDKNNNNNHRINNNNNNNNKSPYLP